MGLRSSQTAYKHLRKLEEAGYVGREGAVGAGREGSGSRPGVGRRWASCPAC